MINDEIRDYLLKHSAAEGVTELSDGESLLTARVIDSAAMVDLIAFLERTYGVTVDEDDMMPENFDSIDAMVAYVSEKRKAS